MRASKLIFRMMWLQFFVTGNILYADAYFEDDLEEQGVPMHFDTSSSLHQDVDFSDSKITQEGTACTWQSKEGKADASMGVENVDQLSQWQPEWDKKENLSKMEGDADKDRDEEKNHSSSAQVSNNSK